MRLQFKFAEPVSAAQRAEVARRLEELGATEVRRLFPEETDAELASLYTVNGGTTDVAFTALELLRDEPAVEFVEAAPKRNLTR